MKTFKKRSEREPYIILDNTDIEEQANMDHKDMASEESGLELTINIVGEMEGTIDEREKQASTTSTHTKC